MTAHQRLISELVPEQHRDLYMNSAHFKNAVDTLVRMLPMMVDGFAIDAERKDAELRAAISAAESMPMRFRLPAEVTAALSGTA